MKEGIKMKKLLSLILCVLMIATALPVGIVYASEEELSDTELLIACIDVLGKAEFTDSFHTKLIAAERMYDELSAAEQKEITNYSLLHDARIEYNYIAGDRIDTSAYTPYAKGSYWCLYTNGLLETNYGGPPLSDTQLLKVNTILVRDYSDNFSYETFAGMNNVEVLIIPYVGMSQDATGYSAHLGWLFGYEDTEPRHYDDCTCFCRPTGSTYTHRLKFDWEILHASGEVVDGIHKIEQVGSCGSCPILDYNYSPNLNCNQYGKYFEQYETARERIIGKMSDEGTGDDYKLGDCPNGWYTTYDATLYKGDYYGVKFNTLAFEIPSTLKYVNVTNATSIPERAFNGCSNIQSIKLSDTVESIGKKAFFYCTGLKNIEFSGNLKRIGDNAFEGCESLTTVVLPDKLTTIESSAFKDCSNLTTITVPLSISYIYSDAFTGSNLTDVWYPGGIANRADVTFYDSNDAILNATWHYDTCVDNHTYTASCDEVCDNCEWIRKVESPHNYDNNCDARCNICNSKRTPADHVYDHACDSSCNECGFERVANPHKEITDKAVAPTCLKSGLTAGTHCSVCGVVVTAQQVVPATGHNVDKNWTLLESSTCSKTGLYVKYCSNCFKIVETEDAPLAPHTLVTDKGVAATCTTTGLTDGSHCSECKAVIVKQEVIPIAEHTPTDTWIVTEESTCSAHGTKVKTCIFCNIIMQTADADLKSHTIVADYGKAATCIYTGLTNGSHCSACNTVLVAQEVIPAKGHTPSAIWTITDTPTCTEKGTKVRYCTVCDKALEKVVMDNTSHTVVTDKAVNATCTDTGLTEGSHCSVCNAVLVAQKVIPAKGHSPSIVWTFTEMPTCTKEGTKVRVCIDCDQIIESVKVDTIPHIEETVPAVKATCLTTGLTEGTRCSVCDTVIIAQETVGLASHDYCYKEVQIDDTDKKYTLGNCSVCGVSILRNCDGIESLTVPEEVTAMADYAIIDGEDLCEVIIGRNVTSMGTNSVGYTATTDEATNEISYIKTDNFVIKGYKNTVAEKYAETNGFEFVPIEDDLGLLGDVNLDGVLNIRDATAIQKHLASLVALDESALTVADFNQDSKINIKDATAIQKRLAGLI